MMSANRANRRTSRAPDDERAATPPSRLRLFLPFLLVLFVLLLDGLLFYRAQRIPTAVPVGIALALLALLALKNFWQRLFLPAACCVLAALMLAAVFVTPLRATQIHAIHTVRFLSNAPAYRAEAARAPVDGETGHRLREWQWETQPVASTSLVYDESDALARRVKPHQGPLAPADQVYPVAPHFYVVVSYAL